MRGIRGTAANVLESRQHPSCKVSVKGKGYLYEGGRRQRRLVGVKSDDGLLGEVRDFSVGKD